MACENGPSPKITEVVLHDEGKTSVDNIISAILRLTRGVTDKEKFLQWK